MPPFDAFVIDAVSHKVFRVPQSSIAWDEYAPVTIHIDKFLRMAETESLGTEHLLDIVTISISNIVALEISGVHSADLAKTSVCNGVSDARFKTYLWATRIKTHSKGGDEIGANFLHIWPPAKATNAFLSRQYRQMRNENEITHGIDFYPPSIDIVPYHIGYGFGPIDIRDCVDVVDTSKLSIHDKLYCSLVHLRTSMFVQRESNSTFCKTILELFNSSLMGLPTFLQHEETKIHCIPHDIVSLKTNKQIRRLYTCSYNCDDPQDVDDNRGLSLMQKQKYQKRHKQQKIPKSVLDTYTRQLRSFETKRQKLYSNLPTDIFRRILLLRVLDALQHENTDHLLRDVKRMRLVSRDTCNTIDNFLLSLFRAFEEQSQDLTDPISFGRNVRSLFISAFDIIHMENTLKPSPRCLPLAIIKLRARRRMQGNCMRAMHTKTQSRFDAYALTANVFDEKRVHCLRAPATQSTNKICVDDTPGTDRVRIGYGSGTDRDRWDRVR
jgi:hypothetical protein